MKRRMVVLLLVSLLGDQASRAADVSWDQLTRQGNSLQKEGRFGQAETSYLAALDLANQFGSQSVQVAQNLGSLGVVYHLHARYAEAEVYLQRSLAILEQARGREDVEVAVTLTNLAELHRVT